MKPIHHTAKQVEHFKQQLSERHFVILMLASGTTEYVSIATALSLPIGTVKSRLHRARLVMDRLMAGEKAAA